MKAVQSIFRALPGPSVALREGHDNFFTPLRLIFALLVVIGHSFVIANGGSEHEPHILFSYTFSYIAVNLFFIVSGFLVTKSMLYRGDEPAFASARLLRIYPALIVHVLFVLLIIGPLASSWPLWDYLSSPDVWLQPLLVLSFVNTDMILPGVFEANGEQLASAPLWTLRYEMLCYIGTLLIFSFGLMRRKWMVLAQFIGPGLAWIVGQSFGLFDALPSTFENLTRFSIAYGFGACLYAYHDRIRMHWLVVPATLALCWALRTTVVLEIAFNLFLGSLVMILAFARLPKVQPLQKLDDISYGIYIYHWAVMQLAIAWFPQWGPASLFTMTLPVILGLAWLSWTCVEKPMLRHKTRFGHWLRFGRNPDDFKKRAVLLD